MREIHGQHGPQRRKRSIPPMPNAVHFRTRTATDSIPSRGTGKNQTRRFIFPKPRSLWACSTTDNLRCRTWGSSSGRNLRARKFSFQRAHELLDLVGSYPHPSLQGPRFPHSACSAYQGILAAYLIEPSKHPAHSQYPMRTSIAQHPTSVSAGASSPSSSTGPSWKLTL
jgi:hypothetical protein